MENNENENYLSWTVITQELGTSKKITFNFKSYNEANEYYRAEIQLSTEDHLYKSGSTQIQMIQNNKQVKEIIISSYINKN